MGTTVAKSTEMNGDGRDLSRLMLFAGNSHTELARRIAEYLGVKLGDLTATKFSDGEIRIQVDESARGNDVFLIQPTCAPCNDTLMELLIMLDAFKRASARRITVVIPYYGYARQDKKIKPREPITARLVADLIQTAGAHRVVAIDLHAEQIQGFFNCPVDHLYGGPIIGRHLPEQGYKEMDAVVVSPDVAGVARAKYLAEMLGKPFVVIAKRRPAPNQVEVVEIIGDFQGKTCIMIDDMIDTGGSIINGAEALVQRGAKNVIASCTHPVFSADACQRIQNSVIEQLICLDTIPIPEANRVPKLTILPSSPLIGEAIRRIHLDESVSVLFHGWR